MELMIIKLILFINIVVSIPVVDFMNGVCPYGRWGAFCTMKCPPTCPFDKCTRSTGECENTSIECQNEALDFNCTETCPNCEWDSVCDPDDGMCKHIRISITETPSCPEGKWGPWCQWNCPRTCKSNRCHGLEGHCEECSPGKMGPYCKKDCPIGTWGADCAKKCPKCDANHPCDPANGKCRQEVTESLRGGLKGGGFLIITVLCVAMTLGSIPFIICLSPKKKLEVVEKGEERGNISLKSNDSFLVRASVHREN